MRALRSVTSMMDELEDLWRGRVARIDELISDDRRRRRASLTVPVIAVTRDFDALTLTVIAEFSAPIERIWQIYSDPRQLEQVYGPPSHPATFLHHELRPGGQCRYMMTAPDGSRSYGWWRVIEVDEPHRLTFEDGHAEDESYTAMGDGPVSTNVYTFEPIETGTRAMYISTFTSPEALQLALDRGVAEGTAEAVGQIDLLVAP